MILLDRVLPEPNSGCWLWTSTLNKDGYAKSRYKGKSYQMHRAYYEEFKGSIPDGLCVLHKCDTPSCVNPDHLFLGTVSDNNADKVKKGRQPKGEKHPNAKLSVPQVRAIKKLASCGWSQSYLAREYGVNFRTVHAIAKNKIWRHV